MATKKVQSELTLLESLGLNPMGRTGRKFGPNSRGQEVLDTITDAVESARKSRKVAILVPMVGSNEEGWSAPAIPAAAKKAGVIVQTELSRSQLRTHVNRWVAQNPGFSVVKFDPGFIIKK